MGKKRLKNGPGRQKDAIGESVSISIAIQLDNFLKDDNETELKFASFLSTHERAFIHNKAIKLGLKSKSRGAGANRFITVYKRSGSTLVQKDAKLVLDANMQQTIGELLSLYPITSREKEELSSCCERERGQLCHKTMGYLNNGIPQVPNTQCNPEIVPFKQGLPVYLQKDQIINTINLNQAVVIVGETGSGKTTQIPQLILEQSQREKKVCRIICTQPRRISAVSVAERVAYERNETIGQSIGYQIRLESRVSPKTVLTYCTNGVLLRTLMGGGSALTSITHVIVDEVHERDKLSDFLLISLRDALTKFRDLRVVLMSATIDPTIFSRYFNNCPVITIPGRLFDVERFFLEDVLETTHYVSSDMKKIQRNYIAKANSPPEAITKSSSKPDLQAESSTSQQAENTSIDPELQADVDEFLSDCLIDGSLDSFGQILYMYVSEGVPVDCQHSDSGMTGLMAAARHGLTETVEQIIKMGGDPMIKDKTGKRALDYAKMGEFDECAHFLENMTLEEVKSSSDVQDSVSSDEENYLVDVYHQTISDDIIDHNLILALIKHIHLTQPFGSILVFLPGYDDIINLRDTIQGCDEMEQAKYQIFTLHSNMQTMDQKRVFSKLPDTRKIIIATNIAETSITIDDVVYVIDAGKVKELYFESASGVCCLQVVWISKACAQQRAGRAGRTRPGKAYMLCSKRRYESLMPNSIPEMLRVPLHELCLHSKLLAPNNTPIAEFLSKALEPPAFSAIRNSVTLLKTIGALTPMEDLTEIGQHLLDLTIEPKLGKMLLYACVLKCLDPILTIACSLAYKEPFQISPNPENRKLGSQSRRNFAAESFSDHMALLRAFQAWQVARTNYADRAFCAKNLISGATMEIIVGMRSQLLAQLRAIGLVKARGPGDIKDANANSEKWHVIKAVLVSGLYPSIARVDREDVTLRTSKEVKLAFHPSSTLHSAGGKAGLVKSLKSLPTDWLVFEEITRVGRFCFIRCNTVVTAMTVALFGGPLRLGTSALRSNLPGLSDDSDSEEENDCNSSDSSFIALDDWVVFTADSNDALSIYLLRQKFAALMIRRMLHPAKVTGQMDDKIIATVVNVLGLEERNMGLSQPPGIGQRPKPLLMDYQRSEASRSRNNDYEGVQNNYDARMYQQPNHSNNFAQSYSQQGTNTFSNNLSFLPSKQNKFQPNYSGYQKQDALYQNIMGVKDAQNVPNVLLANIEKYSNVQGDGSANAIRYFVIKATSHKAIETAQNVGKWNFVATTEKKLMKATQTGKVFLFFSIGGNISKFFGCAEFLNTPCDGELPTTHSLNWISTHQLPHHVTRHLMNGLHENRRVSTARDGQELCANSGRSLMTLLDLPSRKFPNNGRPIQKQPN